ncbi:MAG: hypothetical protein KAU90_03820 [Sulfurovaceae bacterium]|nr:hypothetical protein [Sulfurovaceae bacterium]
MKKVLFLCLLLSTTWGFSQTVTPEKSSWGVEVNPLHFLISDSEWQSFSGTISHFDNENGIEIAIPIF